MERGDGRVASHVYRFRVRAAVDRPLTHGMKQNGSVEAGAPVEGLPLLIREIEHHVPRDSSVDLVIRVGGMEVSVAGRVDAEKVAMLDIAATEDEFKRITGRELLAHDRGLTKPSRYFGILPDSAQVAV